MSGLKYRSFEEAAEDAIKMIGDFVEINTLFVAKNDGVNNTIVRAENKEIKMVEQGIELPLPETYCNLVINDNDEVLIINDLKEYAATKELDVTKSIGGGCFIGLPILYEDGENYGTICGLNPEEIEFTDTQLNLFKTMASLLSYVAQLERSTSEIASLSVPIVPVSDEMAVLPLIGQLTRKRAEMITNICMDEVQRLDLNELVIDLSGIEKFDTYVLENINKIITSMKLLGVHICLSGIRPDVAAQAVRDGISLHEAAIYGTLKRAFETHYI